MRPATRPPNVDRYVLLVLAVSEALALGSVVRDRWPRASPHLLASSQAMASLAFFVLVYYFGLRALWALERRRRRP